uniref:Poly [ADP-ribose] polymerase 12 n=1 Tax=Xenopus tropicalis TaxID=8364 RepID=A0A6I8RQ68_XENTR
MREETREERKRERKSEECSEEERHEGERNHKKRKRRDRNKDGHRSKRREPHHSPGSAKHRAANPINEKAGQAQKLMCSAGGSLGVGQLCRSLGLSSSQAKHFMAQEVGKSVMLRMEGEEQMLVARSALRLPACLTGGPQGALFSNLLFSFLLFHLLTNACVLLPRTPCSFSHDITSGQNLTVLERYQLQVLDIEELRRLLLQNDPTFLPEICKHYNCANGPYGACTFQADCQKLHICKYFLEGECRYQTRCKRPHHLQGPDTLSKLKKWGMGDRWILSLQQIYRNACALVPLLNPFISYIPAVPSAACADQFSNTPDQSEEICLYYIRKNCIFKDKCMKDHYHLPYRWQALRANGWEDMDDMESVEEAYCNISNGYHLFKPWALDLNFDTMTYKSCRLRRLSTPSSTSKPPHYILTTDWLWYWKDEFNRWNEYGKQVRGWVPIVSDICSSNVEKAFLLDKNATINFKAGSQTYELRLKDMVQKNLESGTERKVCRRPKFVSKEDVKNTEPIPSHWDSAQTPDLGFKLVTLDPTSSEHNKVKDLFHSTLRTVSILSIERIQNLSLWEVFLWQREQMKKQNGGKDVEERQLFHGTSDSHIDAICQQNFDWRICGAHGTMYGKGSYFARDASYSHTYTNYRVSQSRVMFLARVLVGEFTAGNPSYLRPCVNSVSCPSIFVIFEKHQIYPEYLIKYLYDAPICDPLAFSSKGGAHPIICSLGTPATTAG